MITVQPGAGALTTPAGKPAVTVYEANFIRLQPFAYLSPSVYPSGAGTLVATPSPTSEFGGSFYTDRTLVTLTLTPTPGSGYNFYDWYNLPYPPSDNPHTFYIQAPTTQAQAVFVPTPVTIVGESLTGPNAWNAGLAGYVDSDFTYLPTAFASTYNSTWTPGSSHTISVDQTQSPVTTNVFYNWNSWSDGDAISHSVSPPASGSQTISASFTPFYAFYTIPAALGGANSSCYGGATTSPAGTAYAENTVFDFYEDGTSVTSTATANPAYPGMVFAGWTGSLSGTTNPQVTTIHGEFVPTANFNTTATPITITSLSPASAPVSSSALAVTINGTGFTSNTTYVYWNGSYRSSTYVSPTQLTMQLNAGDLANPGGQDVFVGNYISNTSSTCGVGAESSFTVTTSATLAPTLVSLTPNSGSGSTQTFTMVYTDPAGLSDLDLTDILFNTSVSGSSACFVTYFRSSNQLFLYNNAGTGLSAAVTPGSATSVSNGQCTLSGTGSSVTAYENNLTLKVALTFSGTFTGQQNVYLYAKGNDGLNSGWVQKGTWTPPTAPSIVSLTPSSGSGSSQTFTMVYTDPAGLSDLDLTDILFNTSVSGSSACFVTYFRSSNQLFLYNNAGTGLSAAVTPGSATSVSNGQCTLSGAGSSFSTSGNNLTLSVALTFSGTFTGQQNVYLYAKGNDGLNSGWVLKGTWTP
jgi:hypothetical protein